MNIEMPRKKLDLSTAQRTLQANIRSFHREADIARACEYLHGQSPDAWTHELILRPSASDWTAPT